MTEVGESNALTPPLYVLIEQAGKVGYSDEDGHFRRKESAFRDFISNEPGSKFPSEKDR